MRGKGKRPKSGREYVGSSAQWQLFSVNCQQNLSVEEARRKRETRKSGRGNVGSSVQRPNLDDRMAACNKIRRSPRGADLVPRKPEQAQARSKDPAAPRSINLGCLATLNRIESRARCLSTRCFSWRVVRKDGWRRRGYLDFFVCEAVQEKF